MSQNNPCPPDCDSVFARVRVNHVIVGGTRVEWELVPDFYDPQPYQFQLQVGRTGNPNADDWEQVGSVMVDSTYAVDDEQRVWGKTNWTHYRICLQTPLGLYFSDPIGGLGILSRRDWRLAREITRKERLRNRYAALDGYLLKRKLYGENCPDCRDFQTNEIRNPDCDTCYGTGFVNGYFAPVTCVYADPRPESRHSDLDVNVRGSIDDIVVPARMLGCPQLHEEDIWVNKKTDERWYVHEIKHVAEIRGIPLVVSAELRLAPFSDQIYEIEVGS